MANWRTALVAALERIDRRYDRVRLGLKLRHGWLDPVEILPYRGHGTQGALYLKGRVLEEKGVVTAGIADGPWRNLRAMHRRFASAEIPWARVRVRYGDCERELRADGEGFFQARLEPSAPPPADRAWHEVEVELIAPKAPGQGASRATGHVLVPPPGAEFGVISDIDDTIIHTGATSLLTMARIVLFGNVHTRLPFQGVAAFYRALQAGPDGAGHNPIFYVSTSPWNLYDLLTDFLDIQAIPVGPLFLRDWDTGMDLLRGGGSRRHKLRFIRHILNTHPALPFVLIGDSGQEDPEIYSRIVREYPGRIRAIYIRDVTLEDRATAIRALAEEVRVLEAPLLLVSDTVAAAQHAVEQGFIRADALPAIREGKREDTRPPALLLPPPPAPIARARARRSTGQLRQRARVRPRSVRGD